IRVQLDSDARRPSGAGDHDVHRLLRRGIECRRGRDLRHSRSADQAHRMTPRAAAGPASTKPLLEIEELKVDFRTDEGTVHAVDGVSFSMRDGEVLSIVGESGSGKSVTAMTILGLTRGPNARISGAVRYHGKDLTTASTEELQEIRGDRIAMVFQDPMSSFNPVQRIGDQIVEAIKAHRDVDDKEAHRKTVESLAAVRIPDPETRARHYPF